MATVDEVREQVRSRYAAAAVAVTERQGDGHGHGQGCGCVDAGYSSGGSGSCCTPEALEQDSEVFGSSLYAGGEQGEVPQEALLASLGCGNPVAVAELHPGETVLDLGSGGGIDVLLSARRVGPAGFAYGVDMTEEMLTLARANAARAGATNVAFLHGTIEDLPLPDASVDVAISNCVINLSADKASVLAEMFRVLKPGGRIGVSDVVAEDQLTAAQRAERGSFSGCIAGALSRQEYLNGLAVAGFVDASVRFTHEAEPQMHAAIIRAAKPTQASPLTSAITPAPAATCCSSAEGGSCREPAAKSSCCGTAAATEDDALPASCGCR